MIKINFEDTYDLIEVAPDFSYATFNSIDAGGDDVLLKVQILPLGDPLLPNVCNLSFGPQNDDGEINDEAKIHHQDTNRMFSTILLFSLAFLQEYPKITIGLDGSNDVRAYLYHRMFLSNREYLGEYFVAIGVDWHVRLLRNGKIEVDVNGKPFFKPRPEPFDFQRDAKDLYRYYMYHLR
jgi:hypothetical protein